jgi:hypothetical protein
VLEEQVVERLLEKMSVETVEMSYQEAIQPPQQKADAEEETEASEEEPKASD